MKKILVSLAIVIIILVGLVPFIDGYLFRKFYLQHIAYYQQELAMLGNQQPQQLIVKSYKLGWFTSRVHLILSQPIPAKTGQYQIPPIEFHIRSVIHHGPLVFVNHQAKLAYAYIETQLHEPAIIKAFIPENAAGFMQVETLVSLSGDTWKNHYVLQPVSIGMAQWDGMSGDVNITMQNVNFPVTLDSTLSFGKLHVMALTPTMPEISTQPISGTGKASQTSFNDWEISSHLQLPGITAKWQDGRSFVMNNLLVDSQYGINNNLYHDDTTLAITNMQLPTPSPISLFSELTLSLSIKNMALDNLQNAKQSLITGQKDVLLKILSANSSITFTLNTDTNLGKVTGNLNASLLALPKIPDEISNNLNIVLNARAAQSLINQLVPSAVINQLLQQGVIVSDKTDYVASFTRKGVENNLNGKIMSDNDLMQMFTTIQNTTLSPPAAPPVPRTQPFGPASASIPVTQKAQQAGYHCYWMNPNANMQWVLTGLATKQDCFQMDSCSGGLKQSGGGCYKWAASPEGAPESWDKQ